MSNIINVDGKDYIRVGDRLIEVDKNGKPKGVWSEETPNAAGGVDCIVHVPCFQIAAKTEK